jgi:hypothetical protein
LFIYCLLTDIWSHFDSVSGNIWLSESSLPESPLPCWIHLLIWNPFLGVLLETGLARMGKLCPMFLARSRCCITENNSKCVPSFAAGGFFFFLNVVLGDGGEDAHRTGDG